MSFISKTIAWVLKAVKSIESGAAEQQLKVDVAPVIVAITGGINTALNSGILGSIAGVIESILPSLGHLPEELVSLLKAYTPKVLASALAIEKLPDNPTADDLKAFEKKVMDAFGIVSDESKVYTTFAADMALIIKDYSSNPIPKTFAQRVALVESIFQAFQSEVLAVKPAVA